MRSRYDPPSASGGEPDPELVRIDARSADYDAVIGPRAEYYRPRFEEYDANGMRLSWNWPAFFITTIWFVYRGMWRIGAINLVYPFIVWFGTLFLARQGWLGPAAAGGAVFILLPLPWILLPAFANALYWRRVRRLLTFPPSPEAEVDPARRLAGLRACGGVVDGNVVALTTVMTAISCGIVSYLAITGVRNYRLQVLQSALFEAQYRSDELGRVIERHYLATHAWPRGLEDLEYVPPRMLYVASMSVDRGSIIVVFNGRGIARLEGHRLIYRPYTNVFDSKILFNCGLFKPRGVRDWGPGPSGTDLDAEYLPLMCQDFDEEAAWPQ